MTSESGNPDPGEELVKIAEGMLKKALLQYDVQHPIVIERYKLYEDLMQRSGRGDQVPALEELADPSQQNARPAEPPPAAVATVPRPTAPPPEPEVAAQTEAVKHLFNSKGKHIATQVGADLYNPSGKFMGTWSKDLEVFIGKNGWYIGQIVDDNRLVRETNWKFQANNFGRQFGSGDIPGWNRQPDLNHFQLSPGFEDAKLAESE